MVRRRRPWRTLPICCSASAGMKLEATSRSCRRKQTTMAWCLYEAHRDKERKFLAKAVCMSIAQDASTRGPLLLTRYVACGPSLERASGILRVADAKQISGAPDLAKSVLRGIRAMATRGARMHQCTIPLAPRSG